MAVQSRGASRDAPRARRSAAHGDDATAEIDTRVAQRVERLHSLTRFRARCMVKIYFNTQCVNCLLNP